MGEAQYEPCFEGPRVALGPMASYRWLSNPRSLLFMLSRYKQVARLLDGCYNVAEVGCGDGFASRMVLDVVGELTLFDFDERFCKEAGANLHDIALDPLPVRYDAVYMLDVFEHIADSDRLMRNLVASLDPDGRLIIGIPSLESQAYASDMSKAGHVSCMSGGDFKRFLEKYMRSVVVFTMNDEAIGTGFFQMAHYLVALCVGVRDEAVRPGFGSAG